MTSNYQANKYLAVPVLDLFSRISYTAEYWSATNTKKMCWGNVCFSMAPPPPCLGILWTFSGNACWHTVQCYCGLMYNAIQCHHCHDKTCIAPWPQEMHRRSKQIVCYIMCQSDYCIKHDHSKTGCHIHSFKCYFRVALVSHLCICWNYDVVFLFCVPYYSFSLCIIDYTTSCDFMIKLLIIKFARLCLCFAKTLR